MTKKNVADLIFILLTATICHSLFSKYGFNPTDEGFVLSATNRVLHGQIPHIDFSSVRPLGYAYLHIPELLFFKNYFFLISRFVFWLEQILIAFLWIRFLVSYSKKEISLLNKYSLILICFIFNVHYFPCSVLHTIDGLLFILIGLNLIISKSKINFLGFFCIGFAALCKQNYLVVLPIVIILFNRKNWLLNSIFGILPIAIYIVFVGIYGGLQDLVIQLSGHGELLQVGVFSYVANPLFYIGIIGIIIYNKIKINKIYLATFLLIFAIAILITNHYHGKYSYLFFGVLIGELISKKIKKETSLAPFIALLIAWSISISVGYNTPALFIGGIISLIIFDILDKNKFNQKVIYALTFSSIIAFYFVRMNNIYRDDSAKKLTYKLDGIVDGACGIYTNLNTFKPLVELELIKKRIPNLIVVPDFTACNILHSHQSKILTEWPNKTEIPNDKILQKVISKINLNDTTLVFAIPKYQTALLKDSSTLYPKNGAEYKIVNYVISNMQIFEDDNYFMLFNKKNINPIYN